MCRVCDFTEAIGQSVCGPAALPVGGFGFQASRRRLLSGGLACTVVAAADALRPVQAAANHALQASNYASIVFRGGAVYTVDPTNPWAQAVAVRGNVIIGVGSNDSVAGLIGPDTRVIELDGRMLLPGFVEGHTHPFVGAFMTAGVDLQLPTRKDALAAVAKYAKANPIGAVRGFGWRVDMFPPEGPNRADLDRIVPDRPAFFFAIDGHSLWVNSKALEIAGIDRRTPDPVPGFSYYARDAKGDPTGYILEVPAVLPAVNAIEPISADAMARLLDQWLPKAAAAGITSLFDAGVPPVGGDQGALLAIYADLEQRGQLPFRVVASYVVKEAPIDGVVRSAAELRRRLNTELVQARVVKIIGDGTAEGYTALLLQPYADKPDTIGQSPFTQEQWTQMVMEAESAGLDIHAHACGEGATRLALNAFEAARSVRPEYDRRHAIAHLVLVDDADVPRFARLGVTAQFSANWMSADPDTVEILLERYGPERQKKIYRPRAILNSGGSISFGTDWPAAGYFSTYKPLDAIQVAVTRQLIGRPNAPILEPVGERLDLAQAIRANTLGAAWQLRLDDKVGSIEVGKRADLVVLEQNLFTIDPHEIAAVSVDMTMMDGIFRHG